MTLHRGARPKRLAVARPRLYSDDTLGLIVDARLNGRTLRNISEMLNAAGIPTPTGRGLWYPSHVSWLLLTRDAQALIASRWQEDQWGAHVVAARRR
nr:hypothetical protein GCM10020092_078930 [Actinoplanes digitatis]